jgi:hypothetical protein
MGPHCCSVTAAKRCAALQMNFYSDELILGLGAMSACRSQAELNDVCRSLHPLDELQLVV